VIKMKQVIQALAPEDIRLEILKKSRPKRHQPENSQKNSLINR